MRNAIPPLLALIAVLLSPSARAATVTSGADSGPGTLRDAIAQAATSSDKIINFNNVSTVTLTSGPLWINTPLTISGPGAANLLIQRSTAVGIGDFRVFNVYANGVVISGLTVSNGRSDM